MAGGSGTRLWPASSSRLPKQFLPANEKSSFFSLALERALSCAHKIIIIAGESHIPHVIKDASKLTAAEKKRLIVIGEPAAKNTAAAIACAVVFTDAGDREPDNKNKRAGLKNMLVLTSDHIIKPLDVFKTDSETAEEACKDKLVVFGIPAAHPETGYGYIETEPKSEKNNIYKVAAFHEKPDLQTAKKYITKKNFFWNSGMFAFNTSFMSEQFHIHASDVIMPFEKLKEPKQEDFSLLKGIKILNEWKGLKAAYSKVKNISFDYAIAEKCDKTAMIRVNFDWIDIGNWDEYIKLDRGESEKNISQVFSTDSNSCFVDSDIPVALAGVDDLIIIIKSGKKGEPASALITKKGRTQKVRDVVDIIKNSGKKDLL